MKKLLLLMVFDLLDSYEPAKSLTNHVHIVDNNLIRERNVVHIHPAGLMIQFDLIDL